MIGANLGLLFTAFTWATQIAAFDILLEHWDPYFLATLRYSWAAPVLLLAVKLTERGPLIPNFVPPHRLWLLGGVGIGLFSPCLIVGFAYSSPVMAAIFTATSPAVAAIVARVFFGTPIDRRMIPAIMFAFVGCSLATYDPTNETDPFTFGGGELLILVANACWSWYSIAAQRWLDGWSQIRITGVTLVYGTIAGIGIYIVAGLLGQADLSPEPARNMTELGLHAWIALACVCGGVATWNYGVKVLGVTVASLFLNMVPIFALVILAMLGQWPTVTQLIGTALVVLGLLTAQLRQLGLRRIAAEKPAEPLDGGAIRSSAR
ncbi:MAG: DMT family transporter [Hyphomicrobium sp.]|uniref:DMT family transporter n=1 Tax=Hyphomicrobium sp. TaxID=82 RepID=UPI003D1367BE